ncbi:MAG: 8-amino-7-oxononanoate synthase [Planctomycetota bacterium]
MPPSTLRTLDAEGPGERLDRRLTETLTQLETDAMRRSLRPLPTAGRWVEIDGRPLLNLTGNDYLALAEHTELKDAAIAATHRYGTGSGASRLVAGHLEIHEQVEAEFAAFKHAESALLFPTGYAANLGTLTALARPGDLICQDKLNHASLIDAARMSDADVRTFPHLDHDKLERLLSNHHAASTRAQRFVVTDSVFSMDGDVADLPGLCALADRYDAVLVVDEAHGTGVLGPHGAGLIEAQGVVGRVPVVVSTASKALGGLGGIVTGSRAVIDTLVNHARPMIYSTAVPPAQAAAIGAAVRVVRDEPGRRERLAVVGRVVRQGLTDAGWPGLLQETVTPILPLVVGDVGAALRLQADLQSAGVLGVAIRPPTVAAGRARVRLSLRADLSDEDVRHLIAAVGSPR